MKTGLKVGGRYSYTTVGGISMSESETDRSAELVTVYNFSTEMRLCESLGLEKDG